MTARPDYRNKLLRSLSDKDLGLIAKGLEAVELGLRFKVEVADTRIHAIYFFESGIASTVGALRQVNQIELSITGNEGMSGVAVILGGTQSPYDCFMQLAGTGYRLSADRLRDAMAGSPTLTARLLAYAQTLLIQVASTAMSNGRANLDNRLARWLLMVHDRALADTFSITHDFLSVMVGVRRPGITEALHKFEGKGLVKASRGQITILDRPGLVAVAGGSYGISETEYARILGAPLAR